jgi:hypothetical protein
MTKLNTILFILILLQIGTVFANNSKYALERELIQYKAILEVQDLLCLDDCEQDTMIAQVVSIRQALAVHNEK